MGLFFSLIVDLFFFFNGYFLKHFRNKKSGKSKRWGKQFSLIILRAILSNVG